MELISEDNVAREKQRSAKFNEDELNLLNNLIKKYKHILLNKQTVKVTPKQREDAWRAITNEFNSDPACSSASKSHQLKNKWDYMKKKAKKVLREQPKKIFQFIADYLAVLLITRENSTISVKLLEDLCYCKPILMKRLVMLGLTKSDAEKLTDTIKTEVEREEPVKGQEHNQEILVVKRIFDRTELDKKTFANVARLTIDAFREYWYMKKTMENFVYIKTDESWEMAVERTLNIYKSTKPSTIEMQRVAEIIKTAYHHYYWNKNLLKHIVPVPKPSPMPEQKPSNKLDVLIHKLDGQLNVELGSMLSIKSKEDLAEERLITKTVTHILNDEEDALPVEKPAIKPALKPAAQQDEKPADTIHLTQKKIKKSFKFVEPDKPDDEVTVSYTQVAIHPQFGKTEQNLSLRVRNENALVAKKKNDGAGDNKGIIPESIENLIFNHDENDDYDFPEDFSDTDSGPCSRVQVSWDALSSDGEAEN